MKSIILILLAISTGASAQSGSGAHGEERGCREPQHGWIGGRHVGAAAQLVHRHPSIIAAVLSRDCRRDKDDVCVVIAKKAQPVPPIYQPEVAAEAVVWAAYHDRREMYVGYPSVQTIVGNKLAPGLGDWYLAQTGYDSQQRDEPDEGPGEEIDAENGRVPVRRERHDPVDRREGLALQMAAGVPSADPVRNGYGHLLFSEDLY